MADESKPEVVAVRTGVGIDSRQKIPYFVGVSEATVGARGLSLQYVIIPPGGAAVPHIHQGYRATRRRSTCSLVTWRRPMDPDYKKASSAVPVNFCTSRLMFRTKRVT
jgi:uncharacterized RmlC-like cupin family protein